MLTTILDLLLYVPELICQYTVAPILNLLGVQFCNCDLNPLTLSLLQ